MKRGDKCWVWCQNAFGSTGTIEEGVIVSVDNEKFSPILIKLRFRDRPYPFFPNEVFQTREALCEHYRKIFE